jgi:hypothetical protein
MNSLNSGMQQGAANSFRKTVSLCTTTHSNTWQVEILMLNFRNLLSAELLNAIKPKYVAYL